jgi:hypothetical protein
MDERSGERRAEGAPMAWPAQGVGGGAQAGTATGKNGALQSRGRGGEGVPGGGNTLGSIDQGRRNRTFNRRSVSALSDDSGGWVGGTCARIHTGWRHQWTDARCALDGRREGGCGHSRDAAGRGTETCVVRQSRLDRIRSVAVFSSGPITTEPPSRRDVKVEVNEAQGCAYPSRVHQPMRGPSVR